MKQFIYTAVISLVLTFNTNLASAKKINFDILAATPVGSWQFREDIETNAKGKKSLTTMRTSLVGIEERNGEKHYWVEMAMENFKVSKKGKRKQKGKRIVVKSLIPESTFSGDPANVMNNLRGFAQETIIQNGNDQPMRMNAGGMMTGMMSALQADMNFDLQELGSEEVTVPGGSFNAQKMQGSGSANMKVVFKKINVESDTTLWISNKVPFGTVKTTGTTLTNGKQSSNASELIEFGMSGAASEITQTPQDMPEMPNLGELFN